MKIIYFSITGVKGPASRYRAYQYEKYFDRKNHSFTVFHAFSDAYLDAEEREGTKKIFVKGYEGVKGFIRRLAGIYRIWGADVVAIEREFFPCFPPFFELLIKMLKGGYILEFDDAVFLSRGRKRKYPATVKMASKVIVGNAYLASFAKRFNSNTTVIPTCIDTKRYTPKEDYGISKPVKIGWVGLAYNFTHLVAFAPVINKICREKEGEFVVLSARRPAIDLPLRFIQWDLEEEMDVIRSFDVGIMPLEDTPYSRGKCGLKVLQYMAAGVPVVASPVGVNREIISDGVNGFLAGTDKEWHEKLEALIEDEELRIRLGKEGRRTVEERYDLDRYGDKLVSIYTQGVT